MGGREKNFPGGLRVDLWPVVVVVAVVVVVVVVVVAGSSAAATLQSDDFRSCD